MSRITKWKIEKTKVKVVFRLQFHATYIPQSGWDKLFISFIPVESGKATAKTTKANVRNGTCKWADPIYETTRLLQDVKTRRFDEKLYKLVVAMGSSRSSILGEATINLADYADALKPSVIGLPLQGCEFGTVLHVTVQLLTSKTGFREFEQQRELRERGLQNDQNSPHESSGGKVLSIEEIINDQVDKVSSRVKFKEKSKDPTSLEEEVGPNEEYADSAVGFDGSSNTSESLYAEKQDTSSAHEIDSLKSAVSGDLTGLSPTQSPQLEKGDPSDHRFVAQGTNDWVQGWSSDYLADNDLIAAYEENSRLKGSLEVAESSIVELKQEISSLQSHADNIGNEAENFAKQLAIEIASGEQLAKEVSGLKFECSKLKEDLEQLKVSKLYSSCSGMESTVSDQDHVLQDIQLRWLQGILASEDKIRELQSKVCFGYHERDFRFLNSDFEGLLIMLQNLRQGTGLPNSCLNTVPAEGAGVKEIRAMSLPQNGQLVTGTGIDVELYQPEIGMLHSLSVPDLSHESDSGDATNAMKGKILELLREVDESKAERDSLVKKMDQMECYYEALVQELEENQRQMLAELHNLRNEHSTSLYTVSATKAEMETVRQDLNDQILRLAEDKRDLEFLNKELERRAVTAEAALKRARLNYSIAVDQLQRDLELLSSQVVSMFETNDNLIRQAFADSLQLSSEGDMVMAQGQKCESRGLPTVDFSQFQNQSIGVKKQQLGGDILLDDLKRSLHLQEGLYRKVEEELCEMHYVNIYLDVLSKTLRETLLESTDDVRHMKTKINELTQQLELLTESKQLLMQELQIAMDDVRSLNEFKATCIARCNDLALQNQTLDANLQSATCETYILMEKITELESLVMQYRSYESKYETCAEEKTELNWLLEKKTLENHNLHNENFSLQEQLKSVRAEFDDLASVKENLQNFINLLENKSQTLLATFNRSFSGTLGEPSCQESMSRDLSGVLTQLEELQHKASEKIQQLMEEKKGLVCERDNARLSFTAAESEISLIKHKFECGIRDLVDKLDGSTVMLEKLQVDVEAITNRLNSSEAEERYAKQHNEHLADLDRLEAGLQELTTKTRDLSHEILSLETVTNELETSKLTETELAKQNEVLIASLEERNEQSTKLESELRCLKENLQTLHDENEALIASSGEKTEESTHLALELSSLKNSLQALHDENQALMASLKDKTEEAAKLESELNSLKESWQSAEDKNQVLTALLQDKTEEVAKLASELNGLKERLWFLHDENQALMESSQDKSKESIELAAELSSLKVMLQSLHDENQALMASSRDKLEESDRLASELDSLKASLQSLNDANHALMASSRDKMKEATVLTSEITSLKESLQSQQDENQVLRACVQDKSEESAMLTLETNNLRESLQSVQNVLHDERNMRDSLERKIKDLTSQLNEQQGQLLQFDNHESEMANLKQMVVDLEAEKSRVCKLLSHHEECLKSACQESSPVAVLETQLSEMDELLISADLRLIFTETQHEGKVEELVQQLHSSKRCLAEVQRKFDDAEMALNQRLASEAQYMEENAKLMTSLNSLQSELEASIAENKLLSDANDGMRAEIEQSKNKGVVGLADCPDSSWHALEVERLNHLLESYEEQINILLLSKEELEVKVLVLKAKLEEELCRIISFERYYDEAMMLQKQCKELTHRLSEQILKTEEFKNLSVHLKELKDKADAECTQAREKKEAEAPPAAMQESLRIAFIKEQYETKLQELKQQLSISKKHSEEMLWKLQDAVDEIENRKKSEASHLKKNEELGMNILELEAELQSVLSDKRERSKAYDLMKAEMECSLISLECCKEEKQKLEASLQECNQEISKLAGELALARAALEESKSPSKVQEQADGSYKAASKRSDDLVFTNFSQRTSVVDIVPLDCLSGDQRPKSLVTDITSHCEEEQAVRASVNVDNGSSFMSVQHEKDILAASQLIKQEILPHGELKHLALINDSFRAESLKSSMDHLTVELERMKNENSLLLQDDHDFVQKFPGLETELLRLQKANEELGSIFPSFNEFSGSGTALERVLALEIELAEALQAKKKSSIYFQSSFLKQHSDEEAIFKSFRDINELIKDMLELKGRYSAVETELKEMHDRYSQLSLHFAEVEGERQKLMMTLKNVRASKKVLSLNRSASASIGDHSS